MQKEEQDSGQLEMEDRKWETGDGRQEMGDRRCEQEMGDRRLETGDGRQEMGERRWRQEMGDRRLETGDGRQDIGDRRWKTGDRRPEAGKGIMYMSHETREMRWEIMNQTYQYWVILISY